ncbi:protein-disulfide reductase DsbD [Pseudomonadota bacterium]
MTRSDSNHRHSFIALLIFACSLLGLGISNTALAEDPTTLSVTNQEEKGISGLFSSFSNKLGLGGSQEAFLPPERAFIFSVDVVNHSQLAASWEITDGYYLYRDKFSFKLKDSPDVLLGTASLRKGKEKNDEAFGLMEVFYKEVTAQIPLIRQNDAPTDITLIVGYQGCAEIGFCYPPMKQEIVLTLPKVDSPAPPITTTTKTTPISEQDKYAQSLSEDSIIVSMLTFLGLGLLLTFTPCVLPMIPILSSIIAGQGKKITTSKAFWLSLTYVLAMSATYTAVGIMAGLFGGNLQAAFQNPWILGSFAALFVVLSLSMFGFYELQLPHKWQSKLTEMSNKQQGGSFIGVAIMGLLSALIVGPCLAAPLAGALIYIGQTGDAVLGGSALFALSIGMGIPLMIIGTSAGKLLPQAGPWMNIIKSIFGVLLLSVAIWMLDRIIPASATLALWGILLVTCAIYLGGLDRLQPEASGWHKLWKGMGIVFLIYGGTLLVGAASGGHDPLKPLTTFNTASAGTNSSTHALSFKQIKGLDELEQQVKLASQQGKASMLDFYADWCVSCKEMERKTFSDPNVQAILSNVVLLQADVTPNDDLDKALMAQYGLFGPPSILFFNAQGQELSQNRLVGFLDAESFIRHVRLTLN